MTPAEQEIADLVLDCAQEWMPRGVISPTAGTDQVPIVVHWTPQGNVLAVQYEPGQPGTRTAEFLITITAEQLPPPGPEDDGALRAELAEQGSGSWVRVTWADVRSGDRVRIPVQDGYAEADVVAPPVPLRMAGSGGRTVRITLSTRPEPYGMLPSGAVEVWRTDAEAVIMNTFPGSEKING